MALNHKLGSLSQPISIITENIKWLIACSTSNPAWSRARSVPKSEAKVTLPWRIFACRFAQIGALGIDVKHIIGNLKSQPDIMRIIGQSMALRLVRARPK